MSVAFQHRVREFRDLCRALREAGVDSVIAWGGHVPTARANALLREAPEVEAFRNELINGLIRVDTANQLLRLANAVISRLLV